MITWENYEEYMMMHADGELQPAEEQELMAFVNQHPQLRQEMADYQRSVLSPDMSQVFAAKESLMKPDAAKKRAIAFPMWQRYSIAAGVAAIVFISLLRLKESSTNSYVAKTDVTKPITTHTVAPIATNQTPNSTPSSTLQPSAPATTSKPVVTIASAHNNQPTTNPINQQPTQSHNTQQQEAPVVLREKITPAASLPVTEPQPLTIGKRDEQIAAVAAPELAPAEEIPAKRSFWDLLPVDESNKKDAKKIANAIVNTYERINSIKENIADKSITICIEKKKLILSF